jgi:hypothetical protein
MNSESSLTTPQDRDLTNKWKPQQHEPPLSTEETDAAMKVLNVTDFTDKFRSVDRTYADPQIPLQTIGLISFYPAKGATPNENGVFGFAKIRGNYATELEASQRAEFLIRNVDSYHPVFHTYVGRPFPITTSSKYSAETDEIDIKKEATKAISTSIKDKKDEELKTIREIKEKEEKLLAEAKKEEVDPYEEYITQRVKLAQLQWTYLEHQRKMTEVKEIVIKTREVVKQMDIDYPEYKDSYYEKYMNARKEAGIVESSSDTQANFIKFLVEDAELDF